MTHDTFVVAHNEHTSFTNECVCGRLVIHTRGGGVERVGPRPGPDLFLHLRLDIFLTIPLLALILDLPSTLDLTGQFFLRQTVSLHLDGLALTSGNIRFLKKHTTKVH